jgi:transcriptional regulator with XRE-family HTH domain
VEPDPDIEAYGRRRWENGDLLAMRQKLGLTRNAMAEFLGTSQATYKTWEEGTVKMQASTFQRIGRFLLHADRQLEWLAGYDVEIADLVPLHAVAGQLGVPNEVLMQRYRDQLFTADDLGILGLWVDKQDVKLIAEVL